MADDSSNAGSDTEDKKTGTTIADDLVVTKYKMAAEITNRVLKEVIEKCVPEASARQVCEFGDNRVDEETAKVFKKEKHMKKGTAFPTCISANNCICHFSPLKTDPDYIIKDGDLLKIDVGCHVDGFIAVVDDLCPECKTGSLDLAVNGDGRWGITWVAVDCPVVGNLQYLFQGSNSYYLKLQVRNHRIPVETLEFLGTNGKYYKGTRTSDNFFEAPNGYPFPAKFPIQVRITGINGQQVIDKVKSISSSPLNGLLGVQLTGISTSAKAVSGDTSAFTPAEQTPAMDNVFIGIVVGAGFLLFVAVLISIVMLHRARKLQLQIEAKP